ncbi:MAG: hypothetical protein JWQ97_1606, partial [Phenylobacterium sp.]|nr:hypothetical protein [Phenylobacterium sp.]
MTTIPATAAPAQVFRLSLGLRE